VLFLFIAAGEAGENPVMERNVMWSPWSGPGLEHLYLREDHEHIAADGLILGVKDQVPFRVHLWLYAINQPETVPTVVAVVFNEGNIVGLRLPRGKFLLPILLPLLSKR